MLATVGVGSLDELVDKAVPSGIRLDHRLELPEAGSEAEILARLRELASQNTVATSMLGMGYSNTITPPSLADAVDPLLLGLTSNSSALHLLIDEPGEVRLWCISDSAGRVPFALALNGLRAGGESTRLRFPVDAPGAVLGGGDMQMTSPLLQGVSGVGMLN